MAEGWGQDEGGIRALMGGVTAEERRGAGDDFKGEKGDGGGWEQLGAVEGG